ncbi:MBG domain-containing protein, partial [Paraflavisolibacter sp. H34]
MLVLILGLSATAGDPGKKAGPAAAVRKERGAGRFAGVTGNYIDFNGSSQQADLGTWFNYQNFTLEMWVRPGSTQTGYADIIDNNHTDSRSWVVQQNGWNTNQYGFGKSGFGGVSFTLAANTWQHLALVATPTYMGVYVNGVLVDSKTGGPTNITYDGTEFLRLANWGGGGRFWNGALDEVKIYNTALTEAQVQAGMAGGTSTGLLARYQMNESSGATTLSDASGNGKTGTLINGPAFLPSAPPVTGGTGVSAPSTIERVEYFLDKDPGYGNGTAVAATAGTDLSNLVISIDPAAIGAGVHRLYARAKNAAGNWSFTESLLFYKPYGNLDVPPPPAAAASIQRLEYYIDADPGYGNATAVPITAGTDLSNLVVSIDPAGLGSGVHRLYTRARNAAGQWSLTNTLLFYKPYAGDAVPPPAPAPEITRLEYYIDTDPGYGNPTAVPITPGTDLSDLVISIDPTNLGQGVHRMHTRARTAAGHWGMGNTLLFYKPYTTTSVPPPAAAGNIALLEYYIDTDPGYGKGTAVSIAPGTDISELVIPLTVRRLTLGDHKVYVRAKDSAGSWSMTNQWAFRVDSLAPLGAEIGTIKGNLCAGGTVAVPFTVNAAFGAGNVFTAQLSNIYGSFANPVTIGTLTGNSSDTIHATIPAGTPAGTGYRIRIISTEPNDTTDFNDTPLTISRKPEQYFTINGKKELCLGTEVYSASVTDAGTVYTWTLSGGGTIDTTGATATVNWTAAGQYALTLQTANACGAGNSQTIQVRPFNSQPVATPTISMSGRTLYASSPAPGDKVLACQWLKNGSAISGATNYYFTAMEDGTYTVRYTNPCGDGPTASPVNVITKQDQVITFTPVAPKVYGNDPVLLSATVNTSLPVTYAVIGGPGQVRNDTLYINGAGTITVRASQAGNDYYNPATSDITVTVARASATVALGNLSVPYNGSGRVPTATTTPAGQPVSFTFNGSSAAPVNVGDYQVVATISSGNYSGTVTDSFHIYKASQTISLTSIPDKLFGNAPFKVKVTGAASSGLPLAYSLVTAPSGIATLVGDSIAVSAAGTIVVRASQGGNGNYLAAPDVADTFNVVASPDLVVKNVTSAKPVVAPADSVNVFWTISNTGSAASATNWTERIYMQTPAGGSRTLLQQSVYANDNALSVGADLPRRAAVVLPAQLNIGDEAVFVVEVVPGAGVQEVPGGAANNTAVQQTAWTISRQLAVELSSAQLTEGTGAVSVLVKRSGSLSAPLTVAISLANSGHFSVPASATIPAGQAGVSFNLSAPDNSAVEGTLNDTLRLSAAGFTAAKAPLSLLDNDKPTLTISNLPAEAMEGSSVTFRVSTNLLPAQPLQVFLTSGSQARFPVPASVTIPAGSLYTDVTVALEADNTPEVDLSVNLVAGAANHHAASGLVQVKDDDLPGLELIVQTPVVSESGGAFATQATLRRKAGSNNTAFTANLSADWANTLLLPTSISLEEGENEKTFTIGVVDNNLVDGQRDVSITAALFVNSCGCSAPPASSGWVSAPLRISDNDGPSLQVTAAQLTLPEGSANAGSIRVARNTATTGALTVSLTSSDTTEATVPVTAVIPAGKSFVDVPVTTINDGITDGNQQVYFHATAGGFSTGSLWLMVSDLNKPDLQLPSVTLGKTRVQAMSIFNYGFSVKNTGAATAPTGVVVRGYLSKDDVLSDDDSLISEDVLATALPAGQTLPVLNAAKAPNLPGQYKLLFWVNPDLLLTELLVTNNKSTPVSLEILPDYTATASVAAPYYLKGTPVPVTGAAVKSDGSAAANEKVEVYIITNGLRRTVTATTNAAGTYTTQFIPLANEAGHYSVGASFPGIGATAEQDAFDLLGVRIHNGQVPQFRVVLGDTLKGTLSVQNLSSRTLTRFTLQPTVLPNGAVIRFDTLASFAGNTSVNLGYSVRGTALSPGTKFEVAQLAAVATEGSLQTADVFYFCQAPNAYVVADVTRLDVAASQSKGERQMEFRLVNKGVGATGNLSVNLPQAAWLKSVTPTVLPSLGSGDTAVVVVKFLALDEVPFNYPISGNIGIGVANGNSFSIPFTFEKKAESNGVVKVEVTDQFTYYTEGSPKVAGARVQVKNYFTGALYADGYTDATGLFVAAGIPEGKHRILVDKEKHESYSGTVTINPADTTEASVFLNYQAITFNWNVVPTAIQDVYDITLTTKFETHVPMPVVTIEMPKSMPQLSGSETYVFQATLTNHGLIAAEDVALNLPQNDPEYEFVTNYVPTRLLAQQSIQVPVLMRRRMAVAASLVTGSASVMAVSQFLGIETPQVSALTTGGGNCQDFAGVVYWYKCNLTSGLWQKGGVLFSYSGRSCTGDPGTGGGDPILIGGGGIGGGGGFPDCAICPTIPQGSGGATPQYETEKKSCKECIKKLIKVVTKCIGPKKLACVGAIVNAIWVCANTETADMPMAMALPAGVNAQFIQNASEDELGAVFQEIAATLQIAVDGYGAQESLAKEYFGDAIAQSEAFADLDSLVRLYTSVPDSIQPAAQTSVLNAMAGYEIQPSAIQSFFTRWNTSVYARSQGVLAPNAQYPDIVNWNRVGLLMDSIAQATARAVAKGFTSVDDLHERTYNQLDSLLGKEKDAVCATVKVQFSQRLTMTREAFEGTLEIGNGHPTEAMDSLSVHIQITDANGVPSNGLFQINTKSLTNLGDVTGTGMLAS